ncbi:MAG TPA: ankyrin repeat domain-containing protein, partial [Blastocatellia bacterium]|nr:ankyrin repeat domain-containing protein [Blastocatellia bacterium]
GADPNEGDSENMTPLGWAVIANRAKTMHVSIARGARVNHVDNFGMTPLLYAASIDFGDTEVLEKLLAAGADVKLKNKQGQTAFDLAKGYNYTKAASLLNNKIASR